MSLVEKLFGSFSDRELKKINPIAKQVLALEANMPPCPMLSCRPRPPPSNSSWPTARR